MEIILLERVEKLGQMGDIVTVKDGYARNFLLPEKKALRASETNQKVFEGQRKEIEARNLEAKSEAEGVSSKMEGAAVILLRQAGEGGQLYGSVTSRDIAAAVRDEGFQVRRGQIILAHPIKEIGLHDVTVRLHPEVSIEIKVNVARTAEEADMQTGTVAEEVFESEDLAEAAVEALTEAPEAEATEEELAEAAEKSAKRAARKAKAAEAEEADEDAEGEDAAPAPEVIGEAAAEEAPADEAAAGDAEEAEKSE